MIEKKEFAIIIFDLNHEVFVVYITAFNTSPDSKICCSKKAEIAHLKVDEALIKVFCKYANFTDVFSSKLAVKFPEYIEINDHVIELVDDQQSFYGSIYSLGLV